MWCINHHSANYKTSRLYNIACLIAISHYRLSCSATNSQLLKIQRQPRNNLRGLILKTCKMRQKEH